MIQTIKYAKFFSWKLWYFVAKNYLSLVKNEIKIYFKIILDALITNTIFNIDYFWLPIEMKYNKHVHRTVL
jgi:hypothetical protein